MADQHGGQRLRGRANECEKLRGLITSAQSDTCGVLVLRGEAGVGKTALLAYTADQASTFQTIQIAGVESDMELAYAALQQLCAPLLQHLDELPEPQRHALNVAFGRGVGPTPDRFLVGLAVLSLMAAAADTQPLLCVVDDAQWLDQVSVQTLGFVARRLMAEPVAMVFAVRDNPDVLAGLPELTISGLSDRDARSLLESVMVGGIDPRVRDRIVAETRGIPLALVEVPRNVPATELAGGFWISGMGSSAGALEDKYVQRIKALAADTQRLLLVAAAEPVGDAALFLRVAAQLGIPVDALGPAESAGMVEFGPRMRFRHPLVRSAAYRAADLVERRAIHRALADATDPESDPDRRAWHAAYAAAGPDDTVAAELEASAGRAQSRGGVAAAATFLERAVALTADPEQRGARALAAAHAQRDATGPEAAHELLTIAEMSPLSELQRAQVARLRAQMEFVRSRGGDPGAPRVSDTAPALLEAARRQEGLDDYASRESYLEALAAVMYAGRLAEPGTLSEVAAAAQVAIGEERHLPRAVDYLLKGIALQISGGAGAGGALRTALDGMREHAQTGDSAVGRWLTLPAFPILQESAAHELWDEETVVDLSTAAVRHARDAGVLAGLPRALVYRAGAHLLAGEFTTAATLIEEADSITAATAHHGPVRYHTLLLTAWRGDPAQALPLIEAAAADATVTGEGRLCGLTGYANAVLHNGLGRYTEAQAAAHEACAYEDFGFYNWSLYELIEAATRSGDKNAAAQALRRLEKRAAASETNWGRGAVACAQAMLAADDRADELFTEAIERLERTRVAVHFARARLCYGEWLRRMNRRIDARTQLNEAHDMFTRMGATAFADRTRRELIATGEKVRKQPVSSGAELTAQEAQIARLAGDGMTNQEIGAQLFISTHTVEWHLRKVFVKLDINSRRQLRTMTWAS
jgi:DNA-binding CsgD family transcriptional regulator